MFLRRSLGRARSLVSLLLGISLVAAPLCVIAGPANAAVTVTRELVDVDFTTASQSGSTIVNNATDKTADLTVFGSPNGLGTNSGLTFSNTVMYNTSQYLTGNLGNTSVMSQIVVEFVARFPDTGCAAQPGGSMVFALGSGSVYIPYNIYRHSNFIGFNTFASDIYGITIPDTTSYHSYKFVMVPGTSPQNVQEIWVDGVQQSLSQLTTSVATLPCSRITGTEDPSSRVFASGTYSDGGFMLMSHPLLATNWGTNGSLKNIRITTTDTYVEPSAPSIDSVTAGDGELSVAFTAPESNGGSAITDYDYSTDNGATWTSASSTSSPIVITGLSNGTVYNVKLRAVNVAGDGAASTAVSGTPVSSDVAPTAPLIDDVVAGNGQLSVYFAPPSNDGGSDITDYEYSLDNGLTWVSAASTVSPIVITGLDNGTSYSVMLRAVSSAGDGAASTVAAGTPSEDGDSSIATLARTGLDISLLLVASLVAIAAGTVVLSTRRRQPSF
jgi:predicted RNA-binding protein with TRAM domain